MKTIHIKELKRMLGTLEKRYIFEAKNQYHLVYAHGCAYQSHKMLIAVMCNGGLYLTAHPIKNRWTDIYLSRWCGLDKIVRKMGIENEEYTLITGIREFRKMKIHKR